ncbi:MAG: hypothetical protein QF724_07195 [Planctomycetota bacterium]|jgi:hypothetical protein|nr:hypothetical protein [Planctomycetota bacterium]MDP6518849.1 hypothetical protein [Planctomycetota bacterium]MDP6838704.1 hypothetical protein [Planctomycetota bacterium]
MKAKTFLVASAALLICGSLRAQTTTIAYESFDYADGNLGGQAGGTGWAAPWWSGNNADNAVVTSPGVDATGGLCALQWVDQGSYRTIDATGWGADVYGNLFGVDNSTIWIRFTSRRVPGATDVYGGLSLFEQWVGEKVFLGCPSGGDELGLHDNPWAGGSSETVVGSSCDNLVLLVYRIDFLPGDERVRLWLDPADTYPAGVADLDTTLGDFMFNEIRLQSGDPATLIAGFEFDAVHLEMETGIVCDRIAYCSSNVNSTGATATMDFAGSCVVADNDFELLLDQGIPGQPALFIYGAGENALPLGNGILCVGAPILRLNPPVMLDATGSGTKAMDLANPPAPSGLITAGSTWNFQGWFRDPGVGGGFNFTDGLKVVFY